MFRRLALIPPVPTTASNIPRTTMHSAATPHRRPRPSRGRRQTPRRGGRYQGHGIALTPVEKGFRYFKYSFLDNPWLELELAARDRIRRNPEEIPLDIDDANSPHEPGVVNRQTDTAPVLAAGDAGSGPVVVSAVDLPAGEVERAVGDAVEARQGTGDAC